MLEAKIQAEDPSLLDTALGTLSFAPTLVYSHIHAHTHTRTHMQLYVSSNKVVWKKGTSSAAEVQKVFTSEHEIEQVRSAATSFVGCLSCGTSGCS